MDAVYFTQRICGICYTAHSMASLPCPGRRSGDLTLRAGKILRDLLHACEFLQNHLKTSLSVYASRLCKAAEGYPLFKTDQNDYRLPDNVNERMVNDYFESMEYSRNAHKMLGNSGRKGTHNHGVFIGGITSPVTADMIIAIKSILFGIEKFITEKMLPDVYEIAAYYSEYYHFGGGYGNLLTYGCFQHYKELGTFM